MGQNCLCLKKGEPSEGPQLPFFEESDTFLGPPTVFFWTNLLNILRYPNYLFLNKAEPCNGPQLSFLEKVKISQGPELSFFEEN